MRIGEYKNIPIMEYKTPKLWKAWLAKNFTRTDGIWLRIFKKDSGKLSINYAQALDEALCYGWIDGQKQSYDKLSWLQKFTPRRPKSVWSKINTGHIKRLIKQGKIQPAGLKQVELAKADGRWGNAYHSFRTAQMPKEFLQLLKKNKKAYEFFKTLNKTNTYAIFYRLQSAKKPETRKRRLEQILAMMAKGQKFY